MSIRPRAPRVVSLILAGIVVVGCSSRPRPALPRLPARAMEGWIEVDGLRVAAQPYADVEQQRQLFDRELGPRYGLLPIFLVVENVGSEARLLRRRWIVFTPESGRTLRASQSAEAVERALGDEGLAWERAVGSPETLYNGRFDLGIAYLFGEALPSKVDAVHYASWQIPEEIELAPGDRLRGFVYFKSRKAARPPTVGTLSVRFRRAGGAPSARPSTNATLRLGAPRPRAAAP